MKYTVNAIARMEYEGAFEVEAESQEEAYKAADENLAEKLRKDKARPDIRYSNYTIESIAVNWDEDAEATEHSIWDAKPCAQLDYCPYGVLVEQFPLPETAEHDEARCSVFGHVCPAFFVGSVLVDERTAP